jgi:hypothetical protein
MKKDKPKKTREKPLAVDTTLEDLINISVSKKEIERNMNQKSAKKKGIK